MPLTDLYVTYVLDLLIKNLLVYFEPALLRESKMAECNGGWKDDEDLQDDLRTYVKQNLRRQEVLDFVQQKYPNYPWSLRTLCRRIKYFDIKFIDYDTDKE